MLPPLCCALGVPSTASALGVPVVTASAAKMPSSERVPFCAARACPRGAVGAPGDPWGPRGPLGPYGPLGPPGLSVVYYPFALSAS